jgi:multidrug efflux pump subunit AcrB
VVRVSDIARVHLGAQSYDAGGRLSGGRPPSVPGVRRPGANQLAVRDAWRSGWLSCQKGFPPGIKYAIPFDTTPFITASMEEVVKTLIEAMLLVTLVVFCSWRAGGPRVIPILAVPVSIIGTFLGLQMLGFTINTLTLFGLVLAIGIVWTTRSW